MDIALDVEVSCIDGVAGHCAAVVLDPVTKVVSQIVVKPNRHGHEQVVVPLDFITHGSVKQIGLRCTLDEFGKLNPFVKTLGTGEKGLDEVDAQALAGAEPHSGIGFQDFGFAGAGHSEMVQQEAIPDNELAVRAGTPVHATDGHVGQVDRFFVRQDSGEIMQLVLLEKHLLSKKDFVIPVEQIDRIGEDAVHLKLSKQAVEQLPRV
jgi:sporulation protein YlmC with PRC-barrel domain